MPPTSTSQTPSSTHARNTQQQSTQGTQIPSGECLERIASAIESQTPLLERVASALEAIAIAQTSLAPAPNIQKSLSSYMSFDWNSIGAKVVRHDQYGATLVWWNGNLFTRRNGAGVKGPAIWFSRAIGKDGENVSYEKLISFKAVKKADPEPLDSRIIQEIKR